MSSVLHPVGPERRATYWRRRLVALLVLLALVAAIVWGISALVGGDDTEAATTRLDPAATSPTLTPSGAPSTSTSTADATPTDPATGTATTAAVAGGPCAADAIASTVATSASTYGPQAAPQLVLTVSNVSSSACTVEIGGGNTTFVVTDSAGERIWANVDCQTSSRIAEQTLQPKDQKDSSTTARVIWPRVRTAAGCPTGLGDVDPGEYTVSISRNGVDAGRATFSIAGS